MTMTCLTCRSPEVERIDQELVAGRPYRGVAKRHDVSEQSVYRHFQTHLPAHLARARKSELESEAADLIEDLRRLRIRVNEVMDNKDATRPQVLMAVDRAVKIVEMLGRFRGALKPAEGEGGAHVTNVQVNINYKGEPWWEGQPQVTEGEEAHEEPSGNGADGR